MRTTAELLVPRIAWHPTEGFGPAADFVARALEIGVGGFVLDGGDLDAVRTWVRDVRRRSRVPLLIGAEGARGAGQTFGGATGLPPLAALGMLDDEDAVRRAARLVAREVRTVGVNWLLAPTADLDLSPGSPVIGTRAFGRDPERVSRLVADWVLACQAEGVLACARHFPGIGRVTEHPEAGEAEVSADEAQLQSVDLVPFRSAIAAGVAALLVGHVGVRALDPSGDPADASRVIVEEYLRGELQFDGLVVSTVVENARVRREIGEARAAVRAAAAGADLLVGASDLAATVQALDAAMADGKLDPDLVERARRRRRKWAQWATPPSDFLRPAAADIAWGATLADRALVLARGTDVAVRAPMDVVVVRDGVYAEQPTAGAALFDALRAAGISARDVPRPIPGGRGTVLVALFGGDDTDALGPRHGAAALRAVGAAADAAAQMQRPVLLVQFAHPRLAAGMPGDAPTLSAWSGDAAMQQAVARWLAARRRTT